MNETCGCCEGAEKLTPQTIANRPGLSALAYRVGSHATFLETMLARLSDLALEIAEPSAAREKQAIQPLRQLRTREADDPSIALLDSWATVAEVLAFYQERIANEGYLRTAAERRSILELARLVGYRLRPGVAATVHLAFDLEKDQNVEIPKGVRAQSIPGPGEMPQAFETSSPLEARFVWNALKPRLTRPQVIYWDNAKNQVVAWDGSRKTTFFFKGITTNLKINDLLLLIFPNRQEPHFINAVEVQADEGCTKVTRRLVLSDFILLVKETAGAFLRVQDFDVDPEDQVAKEIVNSLSTLKKNAGSQNSLETLANELNTQLSKIKSEYKDTLSPELKDWISRIVTALNEILSRISSTSASGVAGSSAFDKLQKLVQPLLKPPSLQPSNPLRRPISVGRAFSKESDIAPQLLVTQRPELSQKLYEAWRQAQFASSMQVTGLEALKSIEILRLKATPFGHNAPLKPIALEDRIVKYEEWPLSTAKIHLILSAKTPGQTFKQAIDTAAEINVEIAIEEYFPAGRAIFSLKDEVEKIVQVGWMTARIAITREAFKKDEKDVIQISKIAFAFVELSRVIKLTRENGKLGVDIDEAAPKLVSENEPPVNFKLGDREVNIVFGADNFTIVYKNLPAPLPSDLRRILYLDSTYDQIKPGTWVIIYRADRADPIIARVLQVQTLSKADYGITGKVTQLTLDREWLFTSDTSLSVIRGTTVYAQSESLELTEEPISTVLEGDAIELNGLFDGLKSGRWLLVSGERTDLTPGNQSDKVRASELVMLTAATQGPHQLRLTDGSTIDLPGDTPHTTLHFANSLAYKYKRDTVTINANVAHATHGETRTQVLGSGDGSKTLQEFKLSFSPLTYVAAAKPSGIESTLEVRVNEVLWRESDNLSELGPTDRNYITRRDNEGNTFVIFGNGEIGARLPTGVENVKAVYRQGIGKAGNVAAEQISLLTIRPLGVKGVINPQPATGGADPEEANSARRNTTAPLKALGRAVSVRDYADFARAFAGIGKAAAMRLSDGRRELVHLTIAGAKDIPISRNSDLYRNLQQALFAFGDPHLPLQIDVRELLLIVLNAQVKLWPEYLWESVEPRIRAALLETFGFDNRDLGQDVLRSEVISTIEAIEGVDYVDVDKLDALSLERILANLSELDKIIELNDRFAINFARVNLAESDPDKRIRPAQLAYLSPAVPDTLMLTERKT